MSVVLYPNNAHFTATQYAFDKKRTTAASNTYLVTMMLTPLKSELLKSSLTHLALKTGWVSKVLCQSVVDKRQPPYIIEYVANSMSTQEHPMQLPILLLSVTALHLSKLTLSRTQLQIQRLPRIVEFAWNTSKFHAKELRPVKTIL